jgi:hypothetical protein
MRAHGLPLCFLLAACAGFPPSPSARKPKVLLLGVDGLRADQLIQAHTPAIDAMCAGGLQRLDATNAWTADEPSSGHSAPNWAAVLTGRRPSATEIARNGDTEHRIDDDDWRAGEIRTLFGYARLPRQKLETLAFHSWPGIGMEPGTILARSITAVDHHLCPPAGESGDEVIASAAIAALHGVPPYSGADPDVLFVYFSGPDAAGHEYTYDDPRYRAVLESLDRLIADVLAAVDARSARADERWLVLLTSDHGGPANATSHGDNGDPHVRTVPLLGRCDGCAFRLDGPASVYDVVPTALEWLGIDSREELEGRSLIEAPASD